MTRRANQHYWEQTHEPLNLLLEKIVRSEWVSEPPLDGLQLHFIPHYAGKHCLQSVRLSRLGNEGGAHAVAVGLLRDGVEALSVVALALSPLPRKLQVLGDWEKDKLTPGQVRQVLEKEVWPLVTLNGIWGERWGQFWQDLAAAVQPYAHFTAARMRWHQHIEMIGGKPHLWINHPNGDFELYRGSRIVAFQLLIFWSFAEIVLAFRGAAAASLVQLKVLADQAKEWLSKNEVFFSGEHWSVQLSPFVYATDPNYWPHG
jgi:hypothetical protein